jgi:hypothetical protein
MSKKDGYCQVKGCKNKYDFIYITHEDEDRHICKSCKEKYLDEPDGES